MVENAEQDIIRLIDEKYSHMSKGHRKIADFIKEHYDQAVFMTAAKIGSVLEVSESTVVRFASGLGFEGYPDFQKTLAAWVKDKLNAVSRMGVKYGRSSQSELLTQVLRGDMEKINDTIDKVDPDAFETAVNSIVGAKTIYIVGIRSCEPLADFLCSYLNMIRGNVTLLKTTSVSEMFEQMLRVGKEDVVIGISFPRYSTRTVRAMEFARDQGATVVAITDSEMSPLYDTANLRLLAKSDMASFVDSLVAPLSLVNALIVAVGRKMDKELAATFEKLEGIWEEYQVYEKPGEEL